MKHATSRILFAYWDSLRGERAAPDRSDVQPGGMRHVLSDTFILANDREPRFRLAGSRICALFGRDIAGASFRNLWQSVDTAEADRIAETVLRDTSGVVAGALGVNANGSEIALELLLLPLRHGRRTDRRMLGALSPATIPSWAGLVPLMELRLRTVRTIETRASADISSNLPMPDRRHPFVLHEGGLS